MAEEEREMSWLFSRRDHEIESFARVFLLVLIHTRISLWNVLIDKVLYVRKKNPFEVLKPLNIQRNVGRF